jgi:starch-binding outer membrane protein SusE/F
MKLRLLLSAFFCTILFTANSQITSVGLIGSATPGGWDIDTNMVQDAVDTSLWTLDITLIAGEAKFRANDAWDINWGNTDFPTGIGEDGGPNIPVFAGDYSITFNSGTGAYSFEVSSPIGIIGDATPGGWSDDTNMYKDTLANGYFVILDLTEGEAKFRKDDAWDINWGSADFPTGTGTQDGDNIIVTPAGKYLITLDTMSGAYNFEPVIEFDSISIIGDATAGGWDTDTDLTQDSGDPDIWRANVTLVDGELKFRANHDWAIAWGGTDFPIGVGDLAGGNIPATAGDYQVTFNTATAEYSFLIIENYNTIGIIGDATPGGWDNDTDLERDPNDSAVWKLRLILTDGEAKFRAENDWAVNWGAGDFPSGIATQDGANIPITAGDYKVTFNTVTGEYNFELVVVFGTVGLIGPATPIGTWDEDVDLIQDTNDEQLWALPSITLTDGEAKFRAENDWAVNWGAVDWPSGIGTQDGPNILVTGGIYSVSLNAASGDYIFADPVSTKEQVLNPASVKVFPNPTNDWLNIDVTNINLKGEINVLVIDMQGRMILSKVMDSSDLMQLDVSNLQSGNYLLQITNTKYIIGKRFSIIK